MKAHVVTLGCPKNLLDSEIITASLADHGLQPTDDPAAAEVIVVNTCAFILPAKRESVAEILELARLKHSGACRWLVVAGCLPQRYGAELASALPEADLFLGTGEVAKAAGLISKLIRRKSVKRLEVGSPGFLMNSSNRRIITGPVHTAYLRISEGCSNRCSYCVIPEIRGPFRSRPLQDIIREAHLLAQTGVKELILIAQDTTAYGSDIRGGPDLSRLLLELAAVRELRWIRILYGNPASIDERTLHAMADCVKICAYLDLPVQHIDDDILKRMNRKSDSSLIHEIIRKARSIVPGIKLRTSLIVGFPGETKRRFDSLLRFVQETKFDHLGVFTYSAEEGTPAFNMRPRVSRAESERRRQIIMEEQSVISAEKCRALAGSIRDVIIDGRSDNPEYPLVGRTCGQAPGIDGVTYVRGRARTGDLVRCRIVDADTYDLFAERA